ncbi:response regulator [candidate division WOR-3 bacterium]|nr:response regulator [candidate division WOR-3 bacterium]
MNNNYRILVIDDETDFVRMLAEFLESREFEVDVATSGVQGLEMFKSASYDLVITDINMPGMNGMELIHEVRAISPEQSIIILTAHPSQRSWDEAQNLGVSDYVFKPFEPDRLMESVQKVLKR